MLRATLAFAAASAVAALDDAFYGQPSPVISWSGKKELYAASSNVVTDDVPVDDVASYLEFSKDASTPKVAVVFAFDNMPTNGMAHLVEEGDFANVVAAREAASSSLVVPNTYGAGATAAAFVEDLPALFGVEGKATLYVHETDAVTEQVDGAAFEVQQASTSAVAEALAAATDASPKFLYVPVRSDAEVGMTLGAVEKAVGSEFVAFAVAAQYEQQQSEDATARRLQSVGGPTAAVGASAALSTVRCTPNIMLGLLLSVFFIFMLWMGFSNMMDIRSNDQFWTSDNVPLGNKVEM